MVARLRWAGAHNYVEWKKDELSKDTFFVLSSTDGKLKSTRQEH